MKKYLSLILVFVILFTSTVALAQMDEKLKNHWSKDMMDKEFVAYYFPYLARKNFEKFNPDAQISSKDFALSLGSLLKDYDLGSPGNIMPSSVLTRKEIVNIIGKKLVNIQGLNPASKRHYFSDVGSMTEESRDFLNLLVNLEILKGVSENQFAPDRPMSQAEAIVILARVEGVLKGVQGVPFTRKGIVQSYNNQEALIVSEKDGKVIVTMTQEFPTPGYGLSVEKILGSRRKSQYEIFLNIVAPEEGSILPQVITYKTLTIAIDKKDLKGKSPYKFIVKI